MLDRMPALFGFHDHFLTFAIVRTQRHQQIGLFQIIYHNHRGVQPFRGIIQPISGDAVAINADCLLAELGLIHRTGRIRTFQITEDRFAFPADLHDVCLHSGKRLFSLLSFTGRSIIPGKTSAFQHRSGCLFTKDLPL